MALPFYFSTHEFEYPLGIFRFSLISDCNLEHQRTVITDIRLQRLMKMTMSNEYACLYTVMVAVPFEKGWVFHNVLPTLHLTLV